MTAHSPFCEAYNANFHIFSSHIFPIFIYSRLFNRYPLTLLKPCDTLSKNPVRKVLISRNAGEL